MLRHFAFFSQADGRYVREWSGDVQAPPTIVMRLGWLWLLNLWSTAVSHPQRGEVGIDVTHIGWPDGDFRYCSFDVVDRRLEWGPDRYYIEIDVATMAVVANQASHRPVASSVPGQVVVDITGTWFERYHGRIFGTFVRDDGGRLRLVVSGNDSIVPRADRLALDTAPAPSVIARQVSERVEVAL